jgi:hypothetical protein
MRNPVARARSAVAATHVGSRAGGMVVGWGGRGVGAALSPFTPVPRPSTTMAPAGPVDEMPAVRKALAEALSAWGGRFFGGGAHKIGRAPAREARLRPRWRRGCMRDADLRACAPGAGRGSSRRRPPPNPTQPTRRSPPASAPRATCTSPGRPTRTNPAAPASAWTSKGRGPRTTPPARGTSPASCPTPTSRPASARCAWK